MSHPHTLLVVGPSGAQRSFVTDNLTYDGFSVSVASAQRGPGVLAGSHVDAVLLDVCEDPMAGLRLLSAIRTGGHAGVDSTVPVMVIGRSSEIDVLRAFELGADEVLRTPYSYPELRARLRALLRRSTPFQRRATVRIGDLQIDPAARRVTYNDQPIELSCREYELLLALAGDPARVMTKPELMRSVWGHANSTSRTLDSHACRLRAKLQHAGATGHIVNVWGVGYRLLDTAP